MRPSAFWIFIFLTLGICPHAPASVDPIDSLKALASNAQNDTTRAFYTNQIGTAFWTTDLDSAMYYWTKALKMGERLAQDADTIVRRAGKIQIMKSASNSALVYQSRGLYPLALKNFQRSLRLAQELGNRAGTMKTFNNIGVIKLEQKNYDEALDYFQRSLAISLEIKDSLTSSTTTNNIATVLMRLNRLDEALSKCRQSLIWAERVDDNKQIADNLANIGSIQLIHEDFDSAYATFRQSIILANKIEYSMGKPEILRGISRSFEGQGRLDSALYYARASLDTARVLDYLEEILPGLEHLAKIQKKLRKFDLATATLEEFIQLKDSFFSESKTLEFGQLEEGFAYENKELQAELDQHAESAALRRKNFQQYLISFATTCVVGLLLLVGVRYAKQRRLRYFVVFGALLFFFEFALVLLDSFVDGFTGGLPIPKLLANVLLAALIAPLNIVLEKQLMRRRVGAMAVVKREGEVGAN